MKHTSLNSVSMTIRELAKKHICEGHLYLVTKEGRKFYIMKPGVFVDPSFLKKHAPQNTVFEYATVINQEVKDHFLHLFKELQYLKFERDLRLKTFEIVSYFQKSYSEKEHFLSFASACYEQFMSLPDSEIVRMHEADMYLFRKSLYSAAFAVMIGMTNDYYHPLILKDFFNLTFALDIGLCEADYSYFVAQACNEENRRPGTGEEWMFTQKANPSEVRIFREHPRKSYEFLKKAPDVLTHKELAEVALYQHELSDGRGFPRGIPKGLVSSWESVVMLADSLVEILDEYDFENDVITYVLDFQNEKLADLPVGKAYKKLCLNLQYFANVKETGA